MLSLASVVHYLMRLTVESVASLRSQFLQEESDSRKQGYTPLHEVSAPGFLRKALDIEEKQCISLLYPYYSSN